MLLPAPVAKQLHGSGSSPLQMRYRFDSFPAWSPIDVTRPMLAKSLSSQGGDHALELYPAFRIPPAPRKSAINIGPSENSPRRAFEVRSRR